MTTVRSRTLRILRLGVTGCAVALTAGVSGFLHYEGSRTAPRPSRAVAGLGEGTPATRRGAVERNIAYARVRVPGRPPATIRDRMRRYQVPAVSVAVIMNYQLDWAAAYGLADVADGRPATPETRFEPGSISKSLNALGVLRLVDQGRIDLDQDVNRYLSSWKFPYDARSGDQKITVRMLLSHTAGLGVHGFPGYDPGAPLPTTRQILDGSPPANTAPVRSLFPPGERFRYSGGGTMISQQIVEDLSGVGYAEYMRTAVLGPLGMTHSFFDQPPPDSVAPLLATGYAASGQPVPGKHPILREQAAGGLWTTPTDLARFVIDLQLSLLGRSNRVLSTRTVKAMTTAVFEGAPGLGVVVEDRQGYRYFQHRAGNRGFSGVYFGGLSSGDGAVVLINSDAGSELVDEVLATIIRVYRWPGFRISDSVASQPAIAIAPDQLDRYVGTYRDRSAVIRIERSADTLWQHAGGSPCPLVFTSPVDALCEESGTRLVLSLPLGARASALRRFERGEDRGRAVRVDPVGPRDQVARTYLGSYRSLEDDQITVLARKDALLLSLGGLDTEIHFLTERSFYLDDVAAVFRFEGESGDARLVADYPDHQITYRRRWSH